MSSLWQRYVTWFYARQPRERLILAGLMVVGTLLLGNNLLIDPALVRVQKARQQVTQLPASTATLRQQTQELIKQAHDPDLAMKNELARVIADQAEQMQRFRAVERSLIPPAQMIGLLESLLNRSRGLELISLHSLRVEPVVAERAGGGDKVLAKPADSTVQLYRHGVELEVAGSYLDLLAYLEALEADAPNMIWGRLSIDAAQYPRSVMRVTAYTLSIDRSWLML